MTATLREKDFQRQLVDLAQILGWSWVHFRPAQTTRGWRTPVSGPMGKGWFDLVLVRGPRILLVELKRDGMKPTGDQEFVHELFAATPAEVYVWRPADLEAIAEVLR